MIMQLSIYLELRSLCIENMAIHDFGNSVKFPIFEISKSRQIFRNYNNRIHIKHKLCNYIYKAFYNQVCNYIYYDLYPF